MAVQRQSFMSSNLSDDNFVVILISFLDESDRNAGLPVFPSAMKCGLWLLLVVVEHSALCPDR